MRPELERPLVDPPIGWEEALRLSQQYMAEQARLEGFGIERLTALIYRRHFGVYYYRALSSRDVVRYGATSLAIEATTGGRVGVDIPTDHRAGNTFSSPVKQQSHASTTRGSARMPPTLAKTVARGRGPDGNSGSSTHCRRTALRASACFRRCFPPDAPYRHRGRQG